MTKYFFLDERDNKWYECHESEVQRLETLGYKVKKVVYPARKQEKWYEMDVQN